VKERIYYAALINIDHRQVFFARFNRSCQSAGTCADDDDIPNDTVVSEIRHLTLRTGFKVLHLD
jgi:hypothetical protein